MINALAIAQVVLKEMIRRKDFYVLFVLTAVICLGAAVLNIFDDPTIVGYLKEICLLLIWTSSVVISVTTAARQIPAEREQRTILPLLAKPVTRGEVVAGKFLGCWLAVGLALAAFYGFYALITAWKHFGSFVIVTWLQAVWLHWLALGIIIAMTILGSVVFAAPSSNATICLIVAAGILLFGRDLNRAAASLAEPAGTILHLAYFVLPHLEWCDVRDLLVFGRDPIPWAAWLLVTPYSAAYVAFFLLLACRQFRRLSLD
jgi:ABC-type transport system involved in multi-copper enzyme maturation permease subunit